MHTLATARRRPWAYLCVPDDSSTTLVRLVLVDKICKEPNSARNQGLCLKAGCDSRLLGLPVKSFAHLKHAARMRCS